jgi:predicted metal-dependent hydrolase
MDIDCSSPLPAKAIEGIHLFNTGKYWLAHEALEAAWRDESGPIRELYRGILQAGVVYLHIEHSNLRGALKVYRRCCKWLDLFPGVCCGVNLAKLRLDLDQAIEEAERLGTNRISEFDRALFKPVEVR